MGERSQLYQTVIVALRKESVDRNFLWGLMGGSICVALRKESVDRNARLPLISLGSMVALRKESVDRNISMDGQRAEWKSRSPQGERG